MRSRFALGFNGAPSATLSAPPEPNEACCRKYGATSSHVGSRHPAGQAQCELPLVSLLAAPYAAYRLQSFACRNFSVANSRKLSSRPMSACTSRLLDDGPPCKDVIALFPSSFRALPISMTASPSKRNSEICTQATGYSEICTCHRTAGIRPHSPSAGKYRTHHSSGGEVRLLSHASSVTETRDSVPSGHRLPNRVAKRLQKICGGSQVRRTRAR